MSSIFTTTPGNTVKGFGGRLRPIPFYLQFVPGVVIEVVHSSESLNYLGDKTINTIIALPHIHDETLVTKATSTGEKYRYYPLFRTMNDIPSKGDPVLLCTIGQTNYYLGPLNTMDNNVTWNDDPSFKPEFVFNKLSKEIANGKVTRRGQRGESLNFNKGMLFTRLTKVRKPNLDFGDAIGETTGDTIMEGRHGNSLRIGSRSNNPYVFISNKRNYVNTVESLGDGSLISITSDGTLADHFPSYIIGSGNDSADTDIPINGFTLASDLVIGNETPPTRYMGNLVSSVNNNQPTQQLIYDWGKDESETGNENQILLHSDRITINSKLDDIYLSSKKDIHIGARRHLTISTSDSLFVESNSVNIGNPNIEGVTMQPMVLGDELLKLLKNIVKVFSEIQTPGGPQPSPLNTAVSPSLKQVNDDIDKILSTKHFIEPNVEE